MQDATVSIFIRIPKAARKTYAYLMNGAIEDDVTKMKFDVIREEAMQIALLCNK
jgi:hypothetical protein